MTGDMLPARGWLSLSEAATYVGISQDAVRGAVYRGDVRAYRKPYTQPRRPTSQPQERLRIAKADLDAWVRTWDEA